MFDEPPARRVIALIVTIGGLMLSALIVSVIGDNISDQLDKLRSGAVPGSYPDEASTQALTNTAHSQRQWLNLVTS